MGIFRREPRWVDSGVLNWTPERPLGWKPRPPAPANDVTPVITPAPSPQPAPKPKPAPVPAPANDIAPAPIPTPAPAPVTPADDAAPVQPAPVKAAAPVEAPAPEPAAPPPEPPPLVVAAAAQAEAAPQAKPEAKAAPADKKPAAAKPVPLVVTPEVPAAATARTADVLAAKSRVRPQRLWRIRLAVGLAQGIVLFLLLQSRSAGIWPGSDGYLFAALSLAALFAPLLFLEGLGEIEESVLYWWSGVTATILAILGLYQHWRLQDGAQAYAGLNLIVLSALSLTFAQILLRAGLRAGKPVAAYPTYFETAWTLVARLSVWAAITLVAWTLLGSSDSAISWLRPHPNAHSLFSPSLLILPLVGLASAASFGLTMRTSLTQLLARHALLACFTVALPALCFIATALLVAHLVVTAQPLWLFLGFGLLLLVACNASYGAGDHRGMWRRYGEFAAAFLIAALMICAAINLHARVTAFGWTHMRFYGAVAIAVLGLYGLLYSFAGLIAIGGGAWMKRIEFANLVLALPVLVTAFLLCTPLADPLRLAVKAQTARLTHGADPATFDFAWLKTDGLRFGQQALVEMTQSPTPEIARDAAVTLATAPDVSAPPPSQIGANITVRTPGARLPAALLTRDWTQVAGVPPCLTKPALACDAWFLDLDHDGAREILLVYGSDARWWASVMKPDHLGQWNPVASFASPVCRGSLSAMRRGDLAVANPASSWQDIVVAGLRLSARPEVTQNLPCPTG